METKHPHERSRTGGQPCWDKSELQGKAGTIVDNKPVDRFPRTHSRQVALLTAAVCLCAASATRPSALGQEPPATPESKQKLREHLDKIVRSSQAIDEVLVGECLNKDGDRPSEMERIGWNAPYAKDPELRAGRHVVVLQLREKPDFFETDFGREFRRPVLVPSLEVALDLYPEPRLVGKEKLQGRLWASYSALEMKANIGFGQNTPFGVFGDTFSASSWSGDPTRRVGLSPQELVRLKPCQTLIRGRRKDGVESRTFFTLPIDLSPDGTFHESFHVPARQVKRVWSLFEDLNGDCWLMWCRKGPEPDTVLFRQCVVQQYVDPEKKVWMWRKSTPVETVTRKMGERHQVSNLSFTLDSMLLNEGASFPYGWVHIADPDLADLPPPVDRK